jgi:ATP-dependent DNA ligase I
MHFQPIAQLFDNLTKTSKRSDKTYLIGTFLQKYATKETSHYLALLLQGRVFEQFENKTIGISTQYVIKALNIATGYTKEELTKLWSELGDLGEVAYTVCLKKKQQTLFSQPLTLNHFIKTIQSLQAIDGNTSVDRKIKLIADVLADANAKEARYVIRFILEVMRTGVGEGTIRDALLYAYFPKISYFHKYDPKLEEFIPVIDGFTLTKSTESELLPEFGRILHIADTQNIQITSELGDYDFIKTNSEQKAKEINAEMAQVLQRALDVTNSISHIITVLIAKDYEKLKEFTPEFAQPLKVMLAQKATSITQAAQAATLPCIAEYKYDGFRMQIHKKDDNIIIYTRRLENVTTQFPEVKAYVMQNVHANQCIIDCEAVGYDPITKKYRPFQFISQRIRRKYDIEILAKDLPVEVNVFDILMYEHEDTTQHPIEKRIELLHKIITNEPTKIQVAKGCIAQTVEELESFYQESLAAGNEGIMVKTFGAEYKPGSRVGTMLKVKPIMDTLDLVITKATWGEGKRANWLTSFTVCCIDEDGNLKEVGKVSSGLKEIESKTNLDDATENKTQDTKQDNQISESLQNEAQPIQTQTSELTTFNELTEELKPSIISQSGKEVTLKPSVVIEVAYEEIQKSTAYSSGFALRFPRIIIIRQARGVDNASTLEQVEGYYYDQHK